MKYSLLALLLLIIAAIIGSFIFKSPVTDQPGKTVVNQPEKAKESIESSDTEAKTPVCRLKLSGKWSQQSESDPSRWAFARDNGKERVTISAMTFNKQPDLEKRTALLDRLVEIRRKAEAEGAPNPITLESVGKGINGDVCAAKFLGHEKAIDRRFACLMMATPTTIITVYFETLKTPESEFLQNAKAALNSVELQMSKKD